ncbi:RNA-binding KH domain-containing protein PEPPER-like isoform X2 [Dioscorea cayenensis subsp. rotundata]|uniref:RNA-binding KH domain-containing protein PEPPER-like isoform X2 n=1 Tax=Dioscorea cayennensis subsp. rotundata TaxID=55577 RepID=A0AB40B3Y6_DIOCR|nr:RNA-binding KH domain-containing protein PEPPER-like isoform X2 [Dioscorea cayenensis subsp. rotundata]
MAEAPTGDFPPAYSPPPSEVPFTPPEIEDEGVAAEEEAFGEHATEEEAPAEASPDLTSTLEEGPVKVKWPGWPGDNVFRLIIPVAKVGCIIGRKGELVKKICEETRASVRVLDGPVGISDRIVLVSGKEEPDLEVSPAMNAVLRVFNRIHDTVENAIDTSDETSTAISSIRLLVPSSQAFSLIGKQGSLIKSIQENSGASVRVLPRDVLPLYAAADEKVVDIHGEFLKVHTALEAVVGHLRKFLVDHGVLPLFEKNLKMQLSQDHPVDTWGDKTQSSGYSIQQTMMEPAVSGLRSPGLGRAPAAIISQMTKKMQIPLLYAEAIIGIEGKRISYIRRASGAELTIRESITSSDEITVEIKGTSQEVQAAELLIQEFISGYREPEPGRYLDAGPRTYAQMPSSGYYPSQPYGRYESSDVGGYHNYRF